MVHPDYQMRVALFTGNYNYIKDGVALTLNRLVAFLEGRGVPVHGVGLQMHITVGKLLTPNCMASS